MNIIFNEVLKEKGIGFTKEFIIDKTISARVIEEKEKVIIKLRNSEYEKIGRQLRIEEIEKVNQVIIGEDTYNNLEYLSHEFYIHVLKDDPIILDALQEDVSITFKKGDDIVG